VRFFDSFYVLLFHIWCGPGLAWTPRWFQTFASGGVYRCDFLFRSFGVYFCLHLCRQTPFSEKLLESRLARIYPSYLLSLLVMAPLFFNVEFSKLVPEQAWAINHMGITAILNILMVQSWFLTLPPQNVSLSELL
jgi:peptidoglycan/LPS O-acetylase OafA/YrhL